MKKYIFNLILIVTIHQLDAQVTFYNNDEVLFKQTKSAFDEVISQSTYIVEGTPASINVAPLLCDYYFIPESNQSYYMVPIKIVNVLRGLNLAVGDTIIGIYKPEGKGRGDKRVRSSEEFGFRPWYYIRSTSCFFLNNNTYPKIPESNLLSKYKQVIFINSELDNFEALYIDENDKRRVSVESGLRFYSLKDWYNYLKQFPDIKIPLSSDK